MPGYTFLKPGSHRIHVMMKNLTARTVIIHQGAKIATISAANIVPHMLAPEEVKVKVPPKNFENDIKIPMKGASIIEESRRSPIEGGVQRGSVELPHQQSTIEDEKPELDRTPLGEEQLEKLYELTKLAEGTAEWTKEQQQKAKDLIKEYSFLFAMSSLDLGRTNIVKHKIELTDYMPLKIDIGVYPPINTRRYEST